MHRIASLLPSCTEIACALGFEDALVGRSHECDHPSGVRALPPLTAPKLDPEGSSAAIDDRVKQLVRDGLSVYRVDADRLRELAPSVILTQQQCDVCAATPKDLEDALASWIGEPPRIVSLEPGCLADVWEDIERVAIALDAEERGREVSARLTERVSDIAQRALRIRERPSVACIEWIDPLMAAGNWMPELVTLAGGRCVFGEAGSHSPWIGWDDLRRADPEVLVVLPCGFDLERTRDELAVLSTRPEWASLRAVRSGRVFVTDGNQYFNRPGPRLVESLEILTEILHPDHFAALHQGVGWQPHAP
jgi:iron complex transport system substrate-binding protein